MIKRMEELEKRAQGGEEDQNNLPAAGADT
jgi:hypothetical protein